MKRILAIAGYDPSSGAGITKDLDVFFSLGIHGLSASTATVVQGPGGVEAVYPVPVEQFTSVLDVVGARLGVDGVKIGVVWDEPYCSRIARFLGEKGRIPVVVDPVARAKNDTPLLTRKGLDVLTGSIFPLSTVVTPNVTEASFISGFSITDVEGMKEAARIIRRMGPEVVVIKGGHLEGAPVDLLLEGEEFTFFEKRRRSGQVHGTGCTFSSAMTSFLVHGYPVREAFRATQDFMESMFNETYLLDGRGYLYSSSGLIQSRGGDRYMVLETLKRAAKRLMELNMADLVPEMQLNVGYAITGAKGIEDVAAFPGRIGRHEGRMFFKGEPCFGASSSLGRMILTFMERYPWMRSGAFVRFTGKALEKARDAGMDVCAPGEEKRSTDSQEATEDGGLDMIVGTALRETNHPPDIISDTGDRGREPIIRLFAQDPLKLIKKMEIIRT